MGPGTRARESCGLAAPRAVGCGARRRSGMACKGRTMITLGGGAPAHGVHHPVMVTSREPARFAHRCMRCPRLGTPAVRPRRSPKPRETPALATHIHEASVRTDALECSCFPMTADGSYTIILAWCGRQLNDDVAAVRNATRQMPADITHRCRPQTSTNANTASAINQCTYKTLQLPCLIRPGPVDECFPEFHLHRQAIHSIVSSSSPARLSVFPLFRRSPSRKDPMQQMKML